jgi:hypothetical protein
MLTYTCDSKPLVFSWFLRRLENRSLHLKNLNNLYFVPIPAVDKGAFAGNLD